MAELCDEAPKNLMKDSMDLKWALRPEGSCQVEIELG